MMYYVGSAQQASDFVTVTNFIINYIRQHYDKGEDIADALENLEETDFTHLEPKMKFSTKAKGTPEQEAEDRQYGKEHEINYRTSSTRTERTSTKRTAARQPRYYGNSAPSR